MKVNKVPIKFLPTEFSFRVFPAGCGPGLTVFIHVVICLSLLSVGILDVPPVIEKIEMKRHDNNRVFPK